MKYEVKDLNAPSPWNMRIWDEAKHHWLCDGEDDVLPYYGFDIRGGEVTAMQSMDWVYRQFEHGRKLIWERSTGLTDKNGKEIYENCELDGRYRVEYIAPKFVGKDMIKGDIIELYDNKFTITKERCEISQNSERSIN